MWVTQGVGYDNIGSNSTQPPSSSWRPRKYMSAFGGRVRVAVANVCVGGRVYGCQCGGNAAHGMHVPTRTSAAVRRFEGPRLSMAQYFV